MALFAVSIDVRRFPGEFMRTSAARNLTTRKTIFGLVLGVVGIAIVTGVLQNRPWTVPEEVKRRKNPLEPSKANLASARALYVEKCANCHGETGKGDGHDAALYDPAPSNFTDPQAMRSVTDGEMFYKISEGRRPMPAYKKKLTEQQRWELILLIRSFADTNTTHDGTEFKPTTWTGIK